MCFFDSTFITCVLQCSAFTATIFIIKCILAKFFQIKSQLNIRTVYSKFYSLAFALIVCQQCVVDTFIHNPAIFIFYFCGIYHVDEAVTLNIKYRIFRILYISVNAPCHARPERRINPSVVYIGTLTHTHARVEITVTSLSDTRGHENAKNKVLPGADAHDAPSSPRAKNVCRRRRARPAAPLRRFTSGHCQTAAGPTTTYHVGTQERENTEQLLT